MTQHDAAKRSAPRVTVVTPTFNRADLVALTIRSVLDQTFRDFEYLVIDDGSNDATAAVVQHMDDPRITYFHHENRGEAATTNRGWAMARGEYFAVLSSDDLVAPAWLERMVALMDENPDILVAYPDYDVIDAQGRVQDLALLPDYDRTLMYGCFRTLPGVGAVIRRSALPDLRTLRNPDLRHAPDLDSWLRLGILGPFRHRPERLGSWRSHVGSITLAERNPASAAELLRIANRFFGMPDLPPDIQRLRRFAMAEALAAASFTLRDSHPLRSAVYLRRSYGVSPAQPAFVPSYWRRPPRPTNRAIARLLARSLRSRTARALRGIGRLLPMPIRRPARALAERLGLLPHHAALLPAPPMAEPGPPAPVVQSVAPADLPPPVPTQAQQRLDALMPQLRDDMFAFRECVPALSPTAALLACLRASARELASPPLGLTTGRILERLPGRIDHLLIVPWVNAVGGSETVTTGLIGALRRLRGDAGLCVLAPDLNYEPSGLDRHQGLAFLGLSDIDPALDGAARQEILDRILVHRRPRVAHCINSGTAWRAFLDRGRNYAEDIALFANIYSDIRVADGVPASIYYYDFLPHCLPHLAGVLADNHTVNRKAVAAFGLDAAMASRMHVVRTPVIGLLGGDPARDLRAFEPSGEKRSLWLSRMATEKRLDVLARLAVRLPNRRFRMHGHGGSAMSQLEDLRVLPNVEIAGAFEALDKVPFGEFDSYVFTTSGEGMPVSLLEVAARGLPVVAPDIGGIGEFVTEETGWLIPAAGAVEHYAEALAQIEAQPEEARRRVEAAQAVLLRDYTRDALDQALGRIPRYLGVAR